MTIKIYRLRGVGHIERMELILVPGQDPPRVEESLMMMKYEI